MSDTRLPSILEEPPDATHSVALPVPCHVGLALRAVLLVETVVAVGSLFAMPTFTEWLQRWAWLTAAALPATVLWLLSTCAFWRVLARRRVALVVQQWSSVALGGLAGLAGCSVLVLTGQLAAPAWLASAASGCLLSALLVIGLTLREQSKLPASTTARLSELQARIRPHFLFNTLNSAIALVRAEPARAEALLEDLSDLFRHALIDQGAAVPLATELALAERYLAIEQVRFGERLQVAWTLDPDAAPALLPPLLLQPLLENAVRHGVEPSPEGARLRISTERRSDRVVIKIANTVPAGPGVRGHGVALANVRARLSLLHDVQGRFDSGLQDGLFLVRIEVPA